MERTGKPSLTNQQYLDIRACSLSKEDIRKLSDILQELNYEAMEHEIKHYREIYQNSETLEDDIERIKEGFKLKLTVTGRDHRRIFGGIKEVFSSTNFPDEILTVYINSQISLKAGYNWYIRNSFNLLLDFSKPDIFNLKITASQPTPNNSYFEASGYESTWVNGIFNEVNNFIKNKSKGISWLHQSNVYDLLFLIFFIPASIWACSILSPLIDKFAAFSVFLKNALYVYIFFCTVTLFHFTFRYARWIWPLVEYQSANDKSSKHRKILGAILISVDPLIGKFEGIIYYTYSSKRNYL